MKKNLLKKTKALILTLALSVGVLAGCTTTGETTTAAEGTKSSTQPSTTAAGTTTGTSADTTADTTASDPSPAEGGTFVVAIGREPGGYNPAAAADDAAYIVNQNIFNKLLKINGNDEIVNDLAESYEFSADGKTLTFHLHKNVKWHDGTEFSAEDVKWTFDQIREEKGFASNSLSDITEVKVVDKDTVAFTLENVNSGILGYIAWMGTYIMPKHLYEGTDWLTNPVNMEPVGTGPFKFTEHVSGDSVTIEKNPDFFGDVPHLDKIIFKIMPDQMTAYQAWLVDEVDENRLGAPATELDNLRNDEKYNLIPLSWPNKSYITFNMQEGAFSDPLVREAVLYGIDRHDFHTRIWKGQGEASEYFIPYQYTWALNEDAKSPERDVAKAMELLEEAGYTKDEDGFYLETSVDTYPGWDEFVPVMKAQFEEFGIKLEHNSMDDPTYDAKVLDDQDFELTLLSGYVGPDISAVGTRFGTGGAMNYGLYSSEAMDAELAAGTEATDLEDRAVHYKKVQEILKTDLPAVFIWDRGSEMATKSYVKGHPASQDAAPKSSEAEFTYVWLDRD